MNRFGRTAQQKMKDRWGGGFILATILALLAAYFVGDKIGGLFGGKPVGGTGNSAANGEKVTVSAEPKEFQLHFVRVGVFRSKANFMKAVRDMNDAGFSPVAGTMGMDGLTPVYAGPFADAAAAESAKAQIQGVKDDYKGAYAVDMAVKYNPAVVPTAASLTGVNDTDMKAGLDTLNSYLQEVAMWMENRSTADTSVLAKHGKELGDLGTKLSASKDAKVKEFANMAIMASTNANHIEGLSNASATDTDYQAAMTDYMNLVSQYMAYQAGK